MNDEYKRDNTKRPCNDDCNNCPIILHNNTRMLTRVMNKLYDKFGDEVREIINQNCPNMAVCADCLIDDFIHLEDCEFLPKRRKENESWELITTFTAMFAPPATDQMNQCILVNHPVVGVLVCM